MPKPPQEGPNPLFTRWLQEWRDQAAESGRLKSQRAYERALSSLRKYPLPLRSGCEARILMYFGEKICQKADCSTAAGPDLRANSAFSGLCGSVGTLQSHRAILMLIAPLQADSGEQLPPTTVRELVLDYVVERKRMPDLCGSIIDGRFREQKVVDGFFVKRTRDIRESAAYLTIMTRHLTRLYEDKMLLSCTKQELEDERPLQPMEGTCRLLTFAEFNEGAVKNKAQTVYEVFARQLMQISGLSGEKAAAILEKYKTPASLMEAYAACPDAENKEQLLSTIKCGQLQR
ncbi:hypothetical protein Chor_014818 [Crotalus horridus]